MRHADTFFLTTHHNITFELCLNVQTVISADQPFTGMGCAIYKSPLYLLRHRKFFETSSRLKSIKSLMFHCIVYMRVDCCIFMLSCTARGVWSWPLKHARYKPGSCLRRRQHTQASRILGLRHSRHRVGVGAVSAEFYSVKLFIHRNLTQFKYNHWDWRFIKYALSSWSNGVFWRIYEVLLGIFSCDFFRNNWHCCLDADICYILIVLLLQFCYWCCLWQMSCSRNNFYY